MFRGEKFKMDETNFFLGRCGKADKRNMFFQSLLSGANSEQGDTLENPTSNEDTLSSTRDLISSYRDAKLHLCRTNHMNCHTNKDSKDFHYRWPQKFFQSEMFNILFLYCIVLLFLPFPACAQNAFQQPLGLEPSQFLMPSFSEKDDGFYHQTTMLENFNGDELDSDWGLDETCKFTATVGRLFDQSLYDKMEKRFPGDITEESEIKIYTSSHLFYDWIVYSETTHTLQGVPLKKHSDVPYHFMIIISDQKAGIKKVPCRVEVKSKESFHLANPEVYLHWKPGLTDLGCLPTETVVTLGIILDVDKEQLSAERRVSMLQRLSSFVHTFSLAQRNSLTLETENIEEHSAFLSGNGDLTGPPKHPPGVGIYWSLGCSADSVELTGLDMVEQSSKNGSLAQLLGFTVTKWRVENRKPKLHHNNDVKRYKREARSDIPKSPVVRHASATPASNGHKSDQNFKRHLGDIVSEDDLDFYLADEYRPPRRARIPNHMIRQSPTVRHPTATPFIPTLPKHHVPSPSSPTVSKPPSSPGHIKINHPPEKDAGMVDIEVQASTYFEYRVPKNAFSDPEEGNTRSLSLRIINTDSLNSEEYSWLRLDETTQVLFGIPPKKKGSSHKTSYGYFLMAEDRDGKSATVSFAIHLTDRPRPTNHRFVMIFSEYDHSLSLPVLVSTFARHLSVALGARWHALRPPGQYTILKVDSSEARFSISWFDNSLGSNDRCEKKGIRRLLSRMGGQSDFESSNQRFAPDPVFKAAFDPVFTLKSIKSVLFGPCGDAIETTILTIPSTALDATSIPSKNKKFIQPPIIIPPQPPTSTFQPIYTKPMVTRSNATMTTTSIKFPPARNKPTLKYEYSPPINLDSNFVMRFSSPVGKAVVKRINEFLFIGGPIPPRPNEFTLKLTANQSFLPNWVTVSSEKWSVVTLPMMSDLPDLEEANSTHKVWRGNLAAVDGYGRETEKILIEVYIPLPPLDEKTKLGGTHLFQMKITNYDLQNFTLLDSIRLLSVICGFYGDRTADNIFVHPLKAGSVVYSWHNDSVPSQNECPYMDIAKLGTVLFKEDPHKENHVKADVYERLLDSGFVVSSLDLKKMNACKKKTVPTTVTTSKTTTTTKSITKVEGTTSSGEDVVTLTAGGISVGLIIVIVVIVCILLLVIVTVIKCRSYTVEKRRGKEKKELENGNGATPVVFSPESSFLADDSRKSDLGTLERQARYKAGTPIILEGESENGESCSPLLHKQQATFSRQLNAPPVALSNSQEHPPDTVVEHAQDDTTRPPPPPYHKSPRQHPS